MKESLVAGISHEKEVATTDKMGVSHLGEGGGVLSTPSMIGLIEQTCLESVTPHLDDNEQTVGTMVHIWHKAAVKIGETVLISSKILERDRRKLLFEVKVMHGETVVGDGTHERFVIDLNKFK
ncbi:MAG: thioesterase family protein [bacterium]